MMSVKRVSGAEDTCPRPDEIAPCQCRTRGPSIQVRSDTIPIPNPTHAPHTTFDPVLNVLKT